MSTPENPESGQLTRRQMRQNRTASTPVVGSDTAVATQEPPAPRAPLARPARPVAVAPAPGPDAAVDLGVSPLTRRQARQQERIRTASVPVITPEVAAAHDAPFFEPSAGAPESEAAEQAPDAEEQPVDGPDAAASVVEDTESDDAEAPIVDAVPVEETGETEEVVDGERDETTSTDPAQDETPSADDWLDPSDAGAEQDTAAPRVDARFGENVRALADPADITGSSSFDELLTREGGSGAVATPHALILTHVPEASPLSAVASTGEVIVTGIYNLPDGLGSQGHAHGAADGKEIDATLIDGELPASSSPTPIAASAAISTVRGTGEIIRPPAPEKSNRWVMGLMITAGALALALVGLLVYVVATGVFN